MTPGRIAVAMSGGVDSSVVAHLLVEAGHDVVGFFLKNGVTAEGPGSARSCCSASDAGDARLVADHLGIPFYSIDVTTPFSRIITAFVDAYKNGRTPNPCVACNGEVKFGHLLDLARKIGAERVATGHYARLRTERDRVVLSRGADSAKDQSYVLSTLTQDQLACAVFPLGGYVKDEVRRIAREASLPVAGKPESQEICFVPTGDYRDLLVAQGGAEEQGGEIVTTDGEVVSHHAGISGFTVGQRRGLNVARGVPQYVVRIETEHRRVVIGAREEANARRFLIRNANWVKVREPAEETVFSVRARIRHHHCEAEAAARRMVDGRIEVSFLDPEFAITPGQTAVLYDGEDVVAAGTIDRVLSPEEPL